MSKICAVANQKGGVGKTTTAVNLSAALAAQGMKVLLVDLDPQGNATTGLGFRKEETASIYQVMMEDVPASEAILSCETSGLFLLPSGIDLAGAELELVGSANREKCLMRVLDPLRDQYDFMIIDCPPSLSLLTLNAFTAADGLIVPIQCEFYALEGLSQLMNTVQRVRQTFNSRLGIEGVVLTMYDSRTNLSGQVAEEVRKYFKNKVFRTVIPRNVRLSEAPGYGQPIGMYDPSCSGAAAYDALASEFIKRGERKA